MGPKLFAEAIVRVEAKDKDRVSPSEIRALTYMASNPMDLTSSTGRGFQVRESVSTYFTMGLYTIGGPSADYIKQEPADPVVASESAYETARQWIADCLDNHEKCPGRGVSETALLPTRVLDVFADCGSDHVKLHESLRGERGQYVALSYCWGKSLQTKTTQNSLQTFTTKGIEISKLPKTLQDAISSTRKLGIPYLWIDSLCIIQDSVTDKISEIATMPQVYKNAMVIISAALASDCDQGFLEDRKEVQGRLNFAARLPFFVTDDDDIAVEDLQNNRFPIGEVFLCADKDIGYDVKEFKDEVVNLRAWTLQETWLSPRVLIYGSGPLQWLCLTCSLTRGQDPSVSTNKYIDPRSLIRERIFISEDQDTMQNSSAQLAAKESDRRNTIDLLNGWYSLVSTYTRRSLTYSEDKLPALSGIATEFHRLLNDEYVAGIWRKGLPYGLLWHPLLYDDEEDPLKSSPLKEKWTKRLSRKLPWSKANKNKTKPQPLPTSIPPSNQPEAYIAPSWSWASSDKPVIVDSVWPGSRGTQLRIHEATVTLQSSVSPFGKVLDGKLVVTGPLRRMEWPEFTERFVLVTSGSPHMFWDYVIPDRGNFDPNFMRVIAEVGSTARLNPQYNLQKGIIGGSSSNSQYTEHDTRERTALRVGTIAPYDNSTRNSFWFLEVSNLSNVPTGLVLMQVPNLPATFKRVGFFKMGRSDPQASESDYITIPRDWDWYGGLEMCTITII
ncbi:hypothetical protein B7463_g3386, partial [Scytalidium lignicola]